MKTLNYSEDDYFIWLAGITGIFKNLRRKLLIVVTSKIFDFLMNVAVLINTVILALDGILNT